MDIQSIRRVVQSMSSNNVRFLGFEETVAFTIATTLKDGSTYQNKLIKLEKPKISSLMMNKAVKFLRNQGIIQERLLKAQTGRGRSRIMIEITDKETAERIGMCWNQYSR